MNNNIVASTAAKPMGSFSNELFTLYTAKDFPLLPDMDWLIDNILPNAGLASVYGHSGVGKSFVCLDIAASIAGGLPWFGHQTNPCSVVYVALEGQAGFRRRVYAWEKHWKIPFPENVKFLFDQFALNHSAHPYGLANIVKQSGGAGLIIIDTLNKAAPGTDENSSVDMGKILAAATDIQQATSGMVLLVHHSGKDASRGLRGHSSLHAALDTVIEAEKDGQLIRLKLVKSKDGEDGISHSFNLTVVEIGLDKNGKTINSCVIEEVEGIATLKKPSEPRGVNQKTILTAVQEILLQQRMHNSTDSPDCSEGISLDDLLSQIKDVLIDIAPKHRQSRTKEALEGLIRQGYLSVKDKLIYLPAS